MKIADGDRPVFFVVEEEPGQPLGFAGYRQSWAMPHAFELIGINITEELRGSGLGSILTNYRLLDIRRQGGTYVTLATIVPEWFARFGFKETDRAAEWHLMAANLGETNANH